jgi:hypothetical protein
MVGDALSMGDVPFFFLPMTSSSFPEPPSPRRTDQFRSGSDLAVSTSPYWPGRLATLEAVDFLFRAGDDG